MEKCKNYILVILRIVLILTTIFYACSKGREPHYVIEPGINISSSSSSSTAAAGAFREMIEAATVPELNTNGAWIPAAPGSSVNISVNAANVLRSISPAVRGNNAAVWVGDNYLLTQNMKDRLTLAGVRLLRFPGGSSSDGYHWNGNYPPGAPGNTNFNNSWAVSTYEFLTLCEELNITPLFTANHGFAVYGSVSEATDLAADWVEYCNAPNDGSNPRGGVDWAAQRASDGHPAPFGVAYWEVGNEVYGSWEIGYQASGAAYGSNALIIIQAMKEVDPEIFTGVAVHAGDSGAQTWTADLLSTPGLGELLDFIDVHEYFIYIPSTPSTSEEVLAAASLIEDDITQLRSQLSTLLPSRAAQIAIYLGEFGTTNPNNPHTMSALSGLFTAKVFGESILHGYDAVSQWDVVNSWDAVNQGDHGFLTKNSPGIADLTPRPSYYATFFFSYNFGHQLVPASSSATNVGVYASRFAGGELGLVIINEDAGDRSASINFSGYTSSGPVNAWQLTAVSLEAKSVKLNGVSGTETEGGPLLDAVTPYFSNAGPTSSLSFDLPGYSVTSLLLY